MAVFVRSSNFQLLVMNLSSCTSHLHDT